VRKARGVIGVQGHAGAQPGDVDDGQAVVVEFDQGMLGFSFVGQGRPRGQSHCVAERRSVQDVLGEAVAVAAGDADGVELPSLRRGARAGSW
jgi:hypothetical protein